MAEHPYPTSTPPKVRKEGNGGTVITIPKGVSEEFGLEEGESPSEIRFDDEDRDVSFSF